MPDNTTFKEVNKLIWPEWKIESLIGEGSFGKVYKAKREEFGVLSNSAIKMISIPQNESEIQAARAEGMDESSLKSYFQGFVADWVSEIKLMESLKTTQNIVSIEDYKITERTETIGWDIAIRMELLTSLNDYITVSRLSKRQIMQMGIDICKALEYCQKLNIVHRDIKPENIFVSRYGEFKLGDFGIARQIEKTSSGLSKKGTFTYMAPEVYKGDAYNSTVDIYSLGIVLYRFMNNNRTPFLPSYPQPVAFSDRERANMKRMTGENIPKPANADGRLTEIVLRACAFKPKERFDRPADMREALEAILYSENEAVLIYPAGDALQNSPVKSAGGSIVDSGKVESAPLTQADNTGEKTEGIFTAYTGTANEAADEKTESVFGQTLGLDSEGTSVSPFDMTGGYSMQSQTTGSAVNPQNALPVNGQPLQPNAGMNYNHAPIYNANNVTHTTAVKAKSKSKTWVIISAAVLFIAVISVVVLNYFNSNINNKPAYAYPMETREFNVEINVKENNVYDVTTKIKVFFNEQKQGIYYNFPYKGQVTRRVDGKDVISPYNNMISDVIVASRNYSTSYDGDNIIVKIGDADKYVTGAQTYEIKYTCALSDDQITAFDDIYWNILPCGWESPIQKSSVTIMMPKPFDSSKLEFVGGADGESKTGLMNYSVSGKMITATLKKSLLIGEGVTVRLVLPEGYFVGENTGVSP